MPVRDPFYTRRDWRALRLRILDRDQWACQINGPGCLGVATHVDHVLPRIEYPDLSMDPSNLRASCSACNLQAGGRLGAKRRRTPPPPRRATPNGYDTW